MMRSYRIRRVARGKRVMTSFVVVTGGGGGPASREALRRRADGE